MVTKTKKGTIWQGYEMTCSCLEMLQKKKFTLINQTNPLENSIGNSLETYD